MVLNFQVPMDSNLLLHPFTLGLGLGLIFTALALWRVIGLKLDLSRFKRHLSERLEVEAASIGKLKTDLETLRKENEQLRIRVAEFNQVPEWRAQRALEVFARAEKRMLLGAPGFAPAWENAKAAAEDELKEEEAGRSLPKRVFAKLFSTPPATREELPPPSTPES